MSASYNESAKKMDQDDLEKGGVTGSSCGKDDGQPSKASVPTATHDDSKPSKAESSRLNLRSLLCVLGTFVGLFCTFGQMNSFGTFQAHYANNQLEGKSSSTISWIGSLQLCMFFASGGLIGRTYDAYGPRALLLSGTLICTLALMLTSISKEYWHFLLAQGTLFGLGVGLIFYPSVASVSTHFSKFRATFIGIALSGSSIGGIVFPIITQELLSRVGFAWTVRIAGFICLACCAITSATVTSNVDPSKVQRRAWIDLSSIRDIEFLTLTAGCTIAAFGLFIPNLYIVENAVSQNLTASSNYLLSILNAGGAIGRTLPPLLSDFYGRFNLLILSGLLAGIACIALWLPSSGSAPALIAFAVLYGILSGSFISLVNPCIFQISQKGKEGTRMGMLNTFVAIPTLLGGPIGGALLGNGNVQNYRYMAVFAGATIFAGSFFHTLTRTLVSRKLFTFV